MRIATWNVNGLRARLEFAEHWLKAREPDLVGLQELKLTDDEFPHEFFSNLGYHASPHGQKGWNGVAVLSKEPVEVLQAGLPGAEEVGARFLRVRSGNLDFSTVYCPNGKTLQHVDYQGKLAWYDALLSYWQSADHADQSVLCGDFNIVPEPVDGWRGVDAEGDIFHTDAERARLAALMATGLQDLYRNQSPDEQAFSWWDYRGGSFHRGHGLRIDFLLGSPALAARTSNVLIDRDYRKKKDGLTASDHAPVIADID